MDRKELNRILLRDYKVNWKNPEDVQIFLLRLRNLMFFFISVFALLEFLEVGHFLPVMGVFVILAMICELLRIWKYRKGLAIVSLILIIYCIVLVVIMFFI